MSDHLHCVRDSLGPCPCCQYVEKLGCCLELGHELLSHSFRANNDSLHWAFAALSSAPGSHHEILEVVSSRP